MCATDHRRRPVELSPAAGVSYADIFPGNVIPARVMDPVAVDLLRFVPSAEHRPTDSSRLFLPAATGQTSPRSVSITTSTPSKISAGTTTSTMRTLSIRLTISRPRGPTSPASARARKQRFQQWNLSHTWTISNTVVNEFRFAYMREAQRTFNHSQHTNQCDGLLRVSRGKPSASPAL